MFFKWADVLEYLKIFSSDSKKTEKKIEKMVEKRMEIVIKKFHPYNHRKFVLRNKDFLEKLKQELVQKHTKETDEKIRGFITMADFKNRR